MFFVGPRQKKQVRLQHLKKFQPKNWGFTTVADINRATIKQKYDFQAWFKADDTKRLFSNFFSLALLQGVNYILPLITLPYLFRILGAEYFGLLAFANATIAYLLIITEYGFSLTATREISVNRNDHQKIIEIFSAVMMIKLFLMVLCFIFLCLLILCFEKFRVHSIIFIYTFGTVIGQVSFPVWFFQGMERMKYITYMNILARSLFTVAIFIFVQKKENYFMVPILSSSGFFVAGLISLLIIKIKFKVGFQWQSRETIISYVKDSWNVFIVDFMPNLYNNFSTFFLGFFSSMEMVGYFSLATRIINIFNSFIYVIRNVTYPYLNNNYSQFSLISKVTMIVGFLFSVGIITLSNNVFVFIFGHIMQNSLLYIYILGLSPFFLSISVVFGSNTLLIFKKDHEMKNIAVKFSLFGFILALFLIPFYGATGAAITVLLSRGLMAFLTYHTAKKYDMISGYD